MSLPSLETLFDTGLPLVLCARPWARDMLAGLPPHAFLPMTGKWHQDRKTVHNHIHASHATRAPSRGLLLPDSLSSALVYRLAGLRCAGYRDDGRSLLLRWPINKPDTPMHAVEHWHYLTCEALRHWGYTPTRTQPSPRLHLPLTATHRELATSLIAKHQLTANRFVLIAPTATGLHKGRIKVWPDFDVLTRRLQQAGHIVVMSPPPSEADSARQAAPTAILLPPLPLGGFAALCHQAGLVICNDSGVSHIAAASGARQLTLFGVTSPDRTGPWSPDASVLGADGCWPDLDIVENNIKALLPGPSSFTPATYHA